MNNLREYLKRHQLIAYFVLTYIFSSTTWIPFNGNIYLMPMLMLGVFSPALVSIGISAILNPNPRQGSGKPAVIAFFIVWILTSVIIIMYLITIGGFDFSSSLALMSAISGLLSAFVVSSAFSKIPGIKDHLRTLIKPSGSLSYYLLALILFPVIEILGIILSYALGMEDTFLNYSTESIKILWILNFLLYEITYVGLCEEPGWRGFALPRLQAKFSPLVSSLILGVLWAIWHIPAKFTGIDYSNLSDMLLQTLFDWSMTLVVTVIFTWFYNRTKGSILVVAVLHASMNTASAFIAGSIITVMLFGAFIIFIIILDRMWIRLPADNSTIFRVNVQEAA